jgi:hypothetical protein
MEYNFRAPIPLFNKGFYLDDQWVMPEGFWICDLRDLAGNLLWEDDGTRDSVQSLQQAWERAIERALNLIV